MWMAVFDVIQVILNVYGYLLIAAAVMSWIPDLLETQIGQVLIRVTDPYLALFRRWIPPLSLGGISLDIAFLIAVVVYFIVVQEVLSVLIQLVG